MALEVSYTAYQSFYLFTKGITKIRINEKYKLISLGPVDFTGIGGMVFLYAPNVGGAVAINAGGIAKAKINDSFAVSLELSFIKYNDGVEIGFSPNVIIKPAFNSNVEIYSGARIEAQIIGSLSSMGSQGGKVNTYLELGLRTGI